MRLPLVVTRSLGALTICATALGACGDDGSRTDPAGASTNPTGNPPGGSGPGGSQGADGGVIGSDGAPGTPGAPGAIAATACRSVVSAGGTAVATKLPPLPELAGLNVCVNVDAANVTFAPFDDAQDYRIYPLPADGDITLGPGGSVVVKDAIYRCAGAREALYMLPDQPQVNDNAAGGATVLNGDVEGFTRNQNDAKLGYVYDAPGAGRVPVYALGAGDPGIEEGQSCGRPIFSSTRPKIYTTDSAKRDQLIANHARDEGIAFYVPAAAGAGTQPVYEGTLGDGDTLRWVDGAEGTARQGKGQIAFHVLTAAAAGTAPLMRVHVVPYCSKQHDELVAGNARFKKVVSEGDHPLNALRWSGLTQKTVLVVEALDKGCPYQGHLSPMHAPAATLDGVSYPEHKTLQDLRVAAASGEVFVNGQSDAPALPKAVARSFIEVTPEPAPAMDFFATFSGADALAPFQPGPNGAWVDRHYNSVTYEMSTYATSQFFYGTMLGELWFAYSDVAADVNGKVRLTANKTATLESNKFLHVTTEVDVLSTARRYPQIIISDQLAPVQDKFASGTTLIVQPKDPTPSALQVQVCDHRTWDVNNQCPILPTLGKSFKHAGPLLGERTGTDNTVKLDVYVSSERLYMFVDDKPYACTAFPAVADDGMPYHPPSGNVTVTWGDVLYHSGVDFDWSANPKMYGFHRAHLQTLARRHFDNLGFSSGKAAPQWNEALYPCVQ